MARGKDGFDSLLVKSEGGEAEEIVSEENGILISMMLRQYFMSLKIMGQWKMWGKSMDRHWQGVQKSMSSTQLAASPKQNQQSGVDAAKAALTRNASSAVNEDETPLDESDEDVSADESEEVKQANAKQERAMKIARKVTKKWFRLAGLSGEPRCCDEVREFGVDWTRVRISRFCSSFRCVVADLFVIGNRSKARRAHPDHWKRGSCGIWVNSSHRRPRRRRCW